MTILVLSLFGPVHFWAFYALLLVMQFVFAWASSNMNSLSMEPLGAVAGTAAAVFGFMQTVGGALIGTFIGQQFNGTLTTNAAAWVTMGVLVLICVLIAEKGRLFSVGVEYRAAPAVAE
jgi:DHA1 family bicyclomycin/chloramphenicol resistance-like MFS transporter